MLRSQIAVVGLAALLSTAACSGTEAPLGGSRTTAPTSVEPTSDPLPTSPFEGDLKTLLLPVPAGAREIVKFGGADRVLSAGEFDQWNGGPAAQVGFQTGVIRQWQIQGVTITIILYRFAEDWQTVFLTRVDRFAGGADAPEVGPVAVGLGGRYYEFARNTASGEPMTIAATSYVDVVVEVSVHGGTMESTRTGALKLIEEQYARFP